MEALLAVIWATKRLAKAWVSAKIQIQIIQMLAFKWTWMQSKHLWKENRPENKKID